MTPEDYKKLGYDVTADELCEHGNLKKGICHECWEAEIRAEERTKWLKVSGKIEMEILYMEPEDRIPFTRLLSDLFALMYEHIDEESS